MNQAFFLQLIEELNKPKRKAVSMRFPWLRRPILFLRINLNKMKNRLFYSIAKEKSSTFFPCVIARHQSVLIRKLGDSDPVLQQNKIVNLKRACQDLDGLIIRPGQVFSLWETVGNPTYARGYVDGMLLSNGKITKGVGGGLCQLSNFLCWLFLHADTELVERHHHSMDVFPDAGRVLPFGSGATCLYNLIDLKFRNAGAYPLQLKMWLTNTHLKGQLVGPEASGAKYSVVEKNHAFVKKDSAFFRYNEIWRVRNIQGKEQGREKIFTNFAPVLYKMDADYLSEYTLIDLT